MTGDTWTLRRPRRRRRGGVASRRRRRGEVEVRKLAEKDAESVTVDLVLVRHDDLVDVVGDERRGLLRLGVDVLVELLDDVGEDLVRGLM